MDHESLKERTIKQQAERKQEFSVSVFGDEIKVDGLELTLQVNFKDAFDPGKLATRYTPLLKQYDYIVGDLSADQLRLRGFYQEKRSVTADQKITALSDYLYEYVNFGAPYFVLANAAPAFRPVPVHDFLTDWEAGQPKKTVRKKSSPKKAKRSTQDTKGTSESKSAVTSKKTAPRPRASTHKGKADHQEKTGRHRFTKVDRNEKSKEKNTLSGSQSTQGDFARKQSANSPTASKTGRQRPKQVKQKAGQGPKKRKGQQQYGNQENRQSTDTKTSAKGSVRQAPANSVRKKTGSKNGRRTKFTIKERPSS